MNLNDALNCVFSTWGALEAPKVNVPPLANALLHTQGAELQETDWESLAALNERNKKMEWNVVVQMLCHAAGNQGEESSRWAELEIQGKKRQSQKTVSHSNYEAKCA